MKTLYQFTEVGYPMDMQHQFEPHKLDRWLCNLQVFLRITGVHGKSPLAVIGKSALNPGSNEIRMIPNGITFT